MMARVLPEINNDIWLPFSQAYATGDVERYLALHAPDFVWVQAEEGVIEGLDDYGARIRQSFADLPSGITMQVAFRFTERIANERLASEHGVSRLAGDGPRGPLPVRYGRFHTIARRGSEGWRLVVDYIYAEGDTVGAVEFEAAHPVDEIAPFTARPTVDLDPIPGTDEQPN